MAATPPPNVKVGMRVLLKGEHAGTVRYVGATLFATGKWVGVELDTPDGKNDGMVKEKRYFTCLPNCGMFVRTSQVTKIISEETEGASSSSIAVPSGSPPKSSLEPSAVVAMKKNVSPISRLPTKAPTPASSDPTSEVSSPKTPKVNKPPSVVVSTPVKSLCTDTPECATPQLSTITPLTPITPGNNEVLRLQAKVDLLERKRNEDKERLKTLEITTVQLEQVTEQKNKVVSSQKILQLQLRDALREAKEAKDACTTMEMEISELSESAELATLDREMAEENLEVMKEELRIAKEATEEAALERDILREERDTGGGTVDVISSCEFKALQNTNDRLKEALVKLRDLATADKNELLVKLKAAESAAGDVEILRQRVQSLSEDLVTSQIRIDELENAVDDAMGAEAMVETLSTRNLDLNDRVTELQETIEDLETLRDLNEELEESHLANEAQLQRHVEILERRLCTALAEVESSKELMADQTITISKFRALVTTLQQNQTANNDVGTDFPKDMTDRSDEFQELSRQLRSSECETASRIVDLELRHLDSEQARARAAMLASLVPDGMLVDHNDTVAVLLLLPRLRAKVNVVLSRLRSMVDSDKNLGDLVQRPPSTLLKFAPSDHSHEEIIDRFDQAGYLSRLSMLLNDFSAALIAAQTRIRFNIADDTVPLAFTAVVRMIMRESSSLESAIDSIVELSRSSDGLMDPSRQRSLKSLGGAIVTTDIIAVPVEKSYDFIPHVTALKRVMELCGDVVQAMSLDIARAGAFIDCNGSEFLEPILNTTTSLHRQCHILLRRMGSHDSQGNTANGAVSLKFPEVVFSMFSRCRSILSSALTTVAAFVSELRVHAVNADTGLVVPVSSERAVELWNTIIGHDAVSEDDQAVAKVLSNVSLLEISASGVNILLQDLLTELRSFDDAIHNGNFDENNVKGDIVHALPSLDSIAVSEMEPWTSRAQAARTALSNAMGLKDVLSAKETELSNAITATAAARKALADGEIKVEVLEKRSGESRVREAENKVRIDSLTENLSKARDDNRVLVEAMDSLQSDIDILEAENSALKKRNKVSKRSNFGIHLGGSSGAASPSDGTMSPAVSVIAGTDMTPLGTNVVANNVVSNAEVRFLQDRVESLQAALSHLRVKSTQIAGAAARQNFASLAPLPVLRTTPRENKHPEQEETSLLLKTLRHASTQPLIIDISMSAVNHSMASSRIYKPVDALLRHTTSLRQWQEQGQDLSRRVHALTSRVKRGQDICLITGQSFKDSPSIGKIIVGDNDKDCLVVPPVKVEVGPRDLRRLYDMCVN